MRLITILLPALAALTEAATLHGCAGKCIGEAIASTGCSSADSNCICSTESFLSSINECVPQTCNPDEQDAAITFAQEFCHKIELAKRGAVPASAPSEAGQLERRTESPSWKNMWGWMKRSPEPEAHPEEHQHSAWKAWPWRLSLRAPPNKHKAAPYHVPWYQKRAWGSTISPPPATWHTVGTVGTVWGRSAHWPPPGGLAKWGLNWRR